MAYQEFEVPQRSRGTSINLLSPFQLPLVIETVVESLVHVAAVASPVLTRVTIRYQTWSGYSVDQFRSISHVCVQDLTVNLYPKFLRWNSRIAHLITLARFFPNVRVLHFFDYSAKWMYVPHSKPTSISSNIHTPSIALT
jgi:hypothetical protein